MTLTTPELDYISVKGFKSIGADKIVEKLSGLKFEVPIGISIGRSNSPKLKTQKDS